jgi:prevent-host-death family protein
VQDNDVDIHDLGEEARELAASCEVSGRRTVISRNGRRIAVLTSWDEYFALRETIALLERDDVRAELELAEDQARRGELLLPEDWFVE